MVAFAAAFVAAVVLLSPDNAGAQAGWLSGWGGAGCYVHGTITPANPGPIALSNGCHYDSEEVGWYDMYASEWHEGSLEAGRAIRFDTYNYGEYIPAPEECDGEGDDRWCRGGPNPDMWGGYFDGGMEGQWQTDFVVTGPRVGAVAATAVVFEYLLEYSTWHMAGEGELWSAFALGSGSAQLTTSDRIAIPERRESSGARTHRVAIPFAMLTSATGSGRPRWSLAASAQLGTSSVAKEYDEGYFHVSTSVIASATITGVTVVDASGRSLNGQYGVAAVGGPVFAAIVTPEPATVGLVAAGLVALGVGARRRTGARPGATRRR